MEIGFFHYSLQWVGTQLLFVSVVLLPLQLHEKMAPCLLLKSQNNSYSNHDCENPKIIDRKLPINGGLLRPMWCSSKL